MKTLLIAINSKYIHSNLAVYYLYSYAKEYKDNVRVLEYTINQQVEKIFQSIYMEKPYIIAFSCYIWNIEIIEKLCIEIRKVLPSVKIWLGGPEVSYDAKEYLLNHQEIDGIMLGEGEETFKELMGYYSLDVNDILLEKIKGIAFRESAARDCQYICNKIIETPPRPLLDFKRVPFPYEDLSKFENKIIYYESSRGCPFSCSYCLSSLDKSIRLRDTDLVKSELKFFLKHKVKQVKFIDRTFNCNKAHAVTIWKYIKDNDNGITNFHFEIAADLLNDEEIQLLNSMRSGLIQLEIGVQSTNPDTIRAISRKTDFKKISENVKQVSKGNNVHQHLDLIAGLPYEDYNSFRNSFNEVCNLRPNQLQMGFLKVLKGTPIVTDSEVYDIVYKDVAPYEVLYTRWISYDDILNLKLVEEMVEVYYNSSQFDTSIKFMEHYFDTFFDLYKELGEYYREHELLDLKYSRIRRYEILLEFMKAKLQDLDGFKEILTYDIYLRENLKTRPSFALDEEKYKDIYGKIYYDEELREKYLGTKDNNYRLGKAKQDFHIEYFNINIEKSAKEGKYIYDPSLVLFNYKERNPLTYNGKTQRITEEIV